MKPKWLEWAQHLQAIAKAGLTYTDGPYDKERYKDIRRIAAEMLADHTDADFDHNADLLAQESGYRATAVKLHAVYDRNQHPHPPIPWHTYKLFFLCQLTGGTPTHSLETNGVGFFREDDLPPLSISRITVAQITRMFEYARHPDWPTDFD